MKERLSQNSVMGSHGTFESKVLFLYVTTLVLVQACYSLPR
jgi:hypothetical protein